MFRFLTLLFISLGLFMAGCSPRYYSPNAHNVPLFTQKGEGQASLSLGTGDDVNGSLDFQGALALSENMALMSNFYTAWGKESGYGSGSGSMFELGAGIFHPISPKLIFSTFGGAGFGGVTNYYEDSKAFSSSLKFSRLFVQPALGFRSRYFDAAFSFRLASLTYNRIQDNIPDIDPNPNDPFWDGNYQNENQQIQDLRTKPTFYLMEPALTLRGGFETVKLQLQLGLSYNKTNPEFHQELINLNVGLVFTIGPKPFEKIEKVE